MNKQLEKALALAARRYHWTHERVGVETHLAIYAPETRGGHRVCALDGDPHKGETQELANAMTDALNRRLTRLERIRGH